MTLTTEGELANLRDLGGLSVGGGRIRTGLLWRSDDVSTVSADQAERLHHAGIRLIVDLRSPAEQTATGRGPLGDYPEIAYRPLPMVSDVSARDRFDPALATVDAAGFGAWYAKLLVARAAELAELVTEIADGAGGALVHCAAGKDRTGVVVATVLSLLGAEDQVIIDDYARTGPALPAIMQRLAGRFGDTDMSPQSISPAVLAAAPETMRAMLSIMVRDHGGIPAMLAGHGVDDSIRQRLRDRLVEPV